MTRARFMLAALLSASGCAVAGDDTTPGDDVTQEDLGAELMLDVAGGDEPAPSICGLLPPCGPCSLACDPDALQETVPEGTCAVLLCTLTDGQRVHVHACNPN